MISETTDHKKDELQSVEILENICIGLVFTVKVFQYEWIVRQMHARLYEIYHSGSRQVYGAGGRRRLSSYLNLFKEV